VLIGATWSQICLWSQVVIGLTTTSPFSVRQAVVSGGIRSVLDSHEQRAMFEIMGDWLHVRVDI
jgi:hypothetical protein